MECWRCIRVEVHNKRREGDGEGQEGKSWSREQEGEKRREGGRRETSHYERREEDGGRGIGRSKRE